MDNMKIKQIDATLSNYRSNLENIMKDISFKNKDHEITCECAKSANNLLENALYAKQKSEQAKQAVRTLFGSIPCELDNDYTLFQMIQTKFDSKKIATMIIPGFKKIPTNYPYVAGWLMTSSGDKYPIRLSNEPDVSIKNFIEITLMQDYFGLLKKINYVYSTISPNVTLYDKGQISELIKHAKELIKDKTVNITTNFANAGIASLLPEEFTITTDIANIIVNAMGNWMKEGTFSIDDFKDCLVDKSNAATTIISIIIGAATGTGPFAGYFIGKAVDLGSKVIERISNEIKKKSGPNKNENKKSFFIFC